MSTREGSRASGEIEWLHPPVSTFAPVHGTELGPGNSGPRNRRSRWQRWVALAATVLVVAGLVTAAAIRPAPVVDGSPQLARGVLLAVGGDEVTDPMTTARRSAVMGSANAFVTLLAFGRMSRVHEPSHDVPAAAGDKLRAFQLAFSQGEVGSVDMPSLNLGLSVDNGAVHRLPLDDRTSSSGQFFVADVPSSARSVDLVLTDAGITQRLSILTGQPGPNNIAVLQRTDRTAGVTDYGHATGLVTVDGHSFTVHLNISVRGADLEYFARGKHPTSRTRAFLYIGICYQGVEFTDPDTCHGFRSTDQFLTPRGGAPIAARDLADDPNRGYTVFEVPANFTSGVLTVRGSESSNDGWHMTITQPYKVAVNF
ncbi:MAG TPA: hypothetical protein VJ831_03160 [Jatrophihabitantaceae bacterium]|nr:hypothetical protein [Jatrophihabitantaceae bacterium]